MKSQSLQILFFNHWISPLITGIEVEAELFMKAVESVETSSSSSSSSPSCAWSMVLLIVPVFRPPCSESDSKSRRVLFWAEKITQNWPIRKLETRFWNENQVRAAMQKSRFHSRNRGRPHSVALYTWQLQTILNVLNVAGFLWGCANMIGSRPNVSNPSPQRVSGNSET